jgi:HD-like signal output (HDOD) protein
MTHPEPVVEENIRRIFRYAEVPVLPQLHHQLHHELQNGADAAAIAQLLAADPSLAECLLKLANSDLYDFALPADTLEQAIVRIGCPQVADLALAILILRMFDGMDPDIVSMQDFWRHSFACGIAARHLATLRGERNVERYFLAGLLHDIGGLLFYVHIPEQALMAILRARDGSGPLHLQEREIVGFDHAKLGRVILQSWELPSALQEGVEHHHTPELATEAPELAATLHVADIIINAMQYGSRGEFIVSPLSPEAWDRLQLPVDTVESTMAQIDRQLKTIARVFFADCCNGSLAR